MKYMGTNLHLNELCHKNHMVPERSEERINDHCARKANRTVDEKEVL